MNAEHLLHKESFSEHLITKVTPPNGSRYQLKLAEHEYEIDEALHLRYNVFNLELNEGLEVSRLTKRDIDHFDKYCDHLIIIDTEIDKLIGTYRLQTYEMATKGIGYYADNEFDLLSLPSKGRTWIAPCSAFFYTRTRSFAGFGVWGKRFL